MEEIGLGHNAEEWLNQRDFDGCAPRCADCELKEYPLNKAVSLREIMDSLQQGGQLEFLVHPENRKKFLHAIGADDDTKEDKDNFKQVLLEITERKVPKWAIYDALKSVGLSDFAEEWRKSYMHPITSVAKNVAPLYCYYNARVHDHLYTTNPREIGTVVPGQVGNNGFLCEGIECLVYTEQVVGTVPLHRCWNKHVEDHLYTISESEIGLNGYRYEGVVGYCFEERCYRHGYTTVPLYRYWNHAQQDHFYTIHQEEAANEITREGVACYVLIMNEFENVSDQDSSFEFDKD